MRRYWSYLKYVLRHKWFVWQASRKIGTSPWLAMIYDASKFSPSEWTAFYALPTHRNNELDSHRNYAILLPVKTREQILLEIERLKVARPYDKDVQILYLIRKLRQLEGD